MVMSDFLHSFHTLACDELISVEYLLLDDWKYDLVSNSASSNLVSLSVAYWRQNLQSIQL